MIAHKAASLTYKSLSPLSTDLELRFTDWRHNDL